MKILFIYTDIHMKGSAKSFHYGIAILSALAKQHGHTTGLYYMYPEYNVKPLIEKYLSFKPDIIAFSSTTTQFKYIKKVLEDLPLEEHVFTICGGPHVTLVPEELEQTPRLNAICRGEGEDAFKELFEALEKEKDISHIKNLWIKKNNGIIRNSCRPFIENLELIPYPDREIYPYQSIIDSDFGTALFMFSRGCPFNCSYCSNFVLSKVQAGKYVSFRSVDGCIKEIKDVLSRYKVKAIYVNDDLFTLKKNFVKEFCEKYKEQIGLPFDINTRVEYIDEDICGYLTSANCRRVNIGIESGNPYIRQQVLNRRMTNEQIKKAFRLIKKAGLKVKSFNMIGMPEETPERFQDTIDLNAELQPDSVILNVFDPYPGTELGERCRKENLIDPILEKSAYIPKTDTILNLPNFPRKKIKRLYKLFAYEVYKKHSLRRALFYRVYYSRYGELLVKMLAPIKDLLRRWTMGV